jgi:hypothetical protein
MAVRVGIYARISEDRDGGTDATGATVSTPDLNTNRDGRRDRLAVAIHASTSSWPAATSG